MRETRNREKYLYTCEKCKNVICDNSLMREILAYAKKTRNVKNSCNSLIKQQEIAYISCFSHTSGNFSRFLHLSFFREFFSLFEKVRNAIYTRNARNNAKREIQFIVINCNLQCEKIENAIIIAHA